MKIKWMMMNYNELQLQKERLKNRILRKEFEIRDGARSIREGLTLPALKNQALQYVIDRPDLIIQTGITVFSLVQKIRRNQKK